MTEVNPTNENTNYISAPDTETGKDAQHVPTNEEPSIKKNYIYNLLNKFVALLIPILVTPYLSRVLEADGNGAISYVASVSSYFLLIANLGIETYGQCLISMYRNDRSYLKRLFWEIFVLRSVITFLCIAIYLVIFLVISSGRNNLLYVVFAFNIIAVVLDFTWFFQGLEKFRLIALTNMVAKAAYVVIVLLFVKSKADMVLSALFTVASTVGPFLLSFPFVFRYIGGKVEGGIKPFSHLKECMVYFVPTVAVQIYTVLDKTMIGLITRSDFENGYYEESEKIIKLTLTLITSLFVIMRSRISYYYSIGETERIQSLIKKSANVAFGLSLPIMFGMIAIAPKFIPVYLGDGYEKCITLIYALSPLVPIISISNLIGTHYYTPFNRQKTSNYFLIIGAVVNVVLNGVLITFYKSLGAAIASVCAEFIITTLYMIFARDFINIKGLLKTSVKYLIASIIMFVPVVLMDRVLPLSIGWLILEVLTGSVVYALSVLLLRVEFVWDLLKEIKSKIARGKK